MEDEDYASEISDTCDDNGRLVSAEEDVLMLFPALTITRQTAQRGLDIFKRSLQSTRCQPRPLERPGRAYGARRAKIVRSSGDF